MITKVSVSITLEQDYVNKISDQHTEVIPDKEPLDLLRSVSEITGKMVNAVNCRIPFMIQDGIIGISGTSIPPEPNLTPEDSKVF